MCYNIHTQSEVHRPEMYPLGRLLEATRKTSVSQQENIMIIKDLGKIKLKNDKQNRHYFLLECESCNEEFTVRKENIKSTCAICSRIGMGKTHGMSETRQYRIWHNMIQRTTNPNHSHHEFYSDKQPPEEWNTFQGFWDDMSEGYSDELSIDRIDNSLPYSKENCRWATQEVQMQNVTLLMKTNTSGYRGVLPSTKDGRWQARCKNKGIINHIGTFDTKEEAAKAYDTYVTALLHPLNFEGDKDG